MSGFTKAKFYLKVFNDVTLLPTLSLQSLSGLFIFLRATNLLSIFAYKIKRNEMIDLLPKCFHWHIQSNINYSERQRYQVAVEIDRIDIILKRAGIKPIFLKGAAYNIEDIAALEGRTMSDIDILVSSSEIKATEETLLSLGWQAKELTDYDERYYREFAHEIPPMFDPISGTTLDIHHNLYLPVSGRAPDELLLREHVIATAGEKHVLAKYMQALHTCVHLYWNEDVTSSLRDLYDFTSICKENASPQFWEELTKTAEKMNLCSLVSDVLCLAAFFFELEYPTNIEKQLNANRRGLAKFKQQISLFVMKRALVPDSQSCKSFTLGVYRLIAYVRGHLMKMPVHVLLPHMLKKVLFSLRKN